MRVWTIHYRAPGLGRPAQTKLVREGFSWLACFFPLLWFLAHRMWVVAGLHFALASLLGLGLPEVIRPWGLLALEILIGFEARNLYRWSLAQQDYALVGVVHARDDQGAALNLADRRPDLARGLA
ncbi:MAG: hypothetical protein RIS83_241 [Pseudomonadota bacterium]|mgnify:CR=1 FL=1|jgi:Protein of unknown function (DUF2628)